MAAAIATLSPRLSFSHDVDISPPRPDSGSDSDFDFSVTSTQDPSPADELFSHGKLLPLSSLNPGTTSSAIKPPPTLENPAAAAPGSDSPKPKSSPIGRSSSVGTGSISRLASICPFPRSKSAGSSSTTPQKKSAPNKKSQSQRETQSLKGWYSYYYSGSSKRSCSPSHGAGVRISPVINVPAPFIPRGGSSGGSSISSGGGSSNGGGNTFFAYLLCNCRDKSSRGFEDFSL